MKIVHINVCGPYDINWGYQENLIAKYHSLDNHDVTVIANNLVTDLKTGLFVSVDKEIEYEGKVKIIRLKDKLPNKANQIIRTFKNFYNTLESENPDFIFVHNPQFFDAIKLVKYLKKHPEVKACVDNHADFSNSAKSKMALLLHKTLYKYLALKLNKVVPVFYGVLPARCDFLHDVYAIPNEKIELLVMGADDLLLKEGILKKEETRQKLGIKKEDFTIITGGKIDEFKTETLDLLDAINEIDNPNVKLIVFGSVVDSLKETFNQKLKDNIYAGWLDQEKMYELFAIGDLAVFPGRHSVSWEQITAFGIPAIYKKWKGTDHVDIGGNCVFIENPDKDNLQIAINEILNNKEKYNAMYNSANTERKKEFLYSEISRRVLKK